MHMMGRTLILTIAVGFSVSSVFGQAGTPIQTGFVAATPVVGFGQGLIVFGRFGYRAGSDVFQSTGWAGAVIASTALVVNSDTASGQNTGISIVNPSGSAASISLTLRNREGTIIGTRAIVLDALHQISQFVGEFFDQVDVTGLLSINSTAPIAVVGFQFKGTSFSLVPTRSPLGETALLIPQFVTGGGWSTDVVIANTTDSTQVVRVDFYNPAGVIIATLPNVTLPAGGVTVINR